MEQSIMFDFHPVSQNVHLQVQEIIPEDGSVPSRYNQISVPRWFKLDMRVPDFMTTENVNNLLALFHLNQGDCKIVPATHVIDSSE
jgi:hypothetical protein